MTRQYSLFGDRWDAYSYRIGVLREPAGRGGAAFVHEVLEPGHLVGESAPRNDFPLVPSGRYLFVAGGIGITPLLPMMHQAELLGADWQLLYGGRRRASMAFLDELAAYGDRIRLHPQDELGILPLADYLGQPRDDVKIYQCGPGPRLDAIEAVCAHWPRYALRTERFIAAEHGPATLDGPFAVELARTGATVTVEPGGSVLDAVQSVLDPGPNHDLLRAPHRCGACAWPPSNCSTSCSPGLRPLRGSWLRSRMKEPEEEQAATWRARFLCAAQRLDEQRIHLRPDLSTRGDDCVTLHTRWNGRLRAVAGAMPYDWPEIDPTRAGR